MLVKAITVSQTLEHDEIYKFSMIILSMGENLHLVSVIIITVVILHTCSEAPVCLTALDLLRAGLTSGRAARVLQTQHTEVSGNSSSSTGLVFVCFISAAYALFTVYATK